MVATREFLRKMSSYYMCKYVFSISFRNNGIFISFTRGSSSSSRELNNSNATRCLANANRISEFSESKQMGGLLRKG